MPQNRTPLGELLRIVVPICVLLAGIGGFAVMLLSKQKPDSVPVENRPPKVEVIAVEAYNHALEIKVDGVVAPFRDLEVAAEVAGKVKTRTAACRKGSYVTRGTLLFEIDNRDYDLEVKRLGQELSQSGDLIQELDVEAENAQKHLDLARLDLELQKKEMQRLTNIARGVVSESELDRTKRTQMAAENSVLTHANMLRLLQARRSRTERARELVETQLEKARLDLERTRILAPVDGVVVRDPVEQNAYVQKGTVLAAIEDTSSVEVKCNLRMEELYWLWQRPKIDPNAVSASFDEQAADDYGIPPTPVAVLYSLAGREFSWNGILSRYDGLGIDEKTRTVPCRVLVADPRGATAVVSKASGLPENQRQEVRPPALMRGMYVTLKIQIPAGDRFSLLRIPTAAVRPGSKVWLVRNGKLHVQRVQTAMLHEKDVIISADGSRLKVGDKLVISPLAVDEGLLEGMAVEEQAAK